MILLEEPVGIEEAKLHLEEAIKPFQAELKSRQKKLEFVKKCIQSVEKEDFFQLDELLRSKQASEAAEDPDLKGFASVFPHLKAYVHEQIEKYMSEFKSGLERAAEEVGLSVKVDLPRFSVLKGIEGEVDFASRRAVLGELKIRSISPKRIMAAAASLKRKFYDSPFEPQLFIDSLFACYQEIVKRERMAIGEVVPIHQLYTDYTWSLQSKAFLQNMDKAKFRGYSAQQFAIDLWRFFVSESHATEGGYSIRLAPGRGRSMWLIDHLGERRQISHASFGKESE